MAESSSNHSSTYLNVNVLTDDISHLVKRNYRRFNKPVPTWLQNLHRGQFHLNKCHNNSIEPDQLKAATRFVSLCLFSLVQELLQMWDTTTAHLQNQNNRELFLFFSRCRRCGKATLGRAMLSGVRWKGQEGSPKFTWETRAIFHHNPCKLRFFS